MGSGVKQSEERRKRPFYRNVLQWLFVIFIFLFLGKMVWENWGQIKEAPFTFRLLPLFLSTALFALSYFVQIWAWYLITLNLGIALPFQETLEGWFYSQMGKYLPGKVWLLLGRFYFYDSKGKSRKTLTVALYFETVTMMVAAGLLFFASLLFFREVQSAPFRWAFLWLVLILPAAPFSLHPRILQRISNGILRFLKRQPITISMSYPDILRVLGVCLCSWVMGGVGFYLFVDSVFPVSSGHILFLTGALAISNTLGLLALFAPGGLGVREGVLVFLLSSIMPGSVAVVLSVLTRLWMTLIEIGLIGVVYLTGKFRRMGRA
jgi:uncharacterized membrane protein YbhN (UPF0104 family)